MSHPAPNHIKLHKKSRTLELIYADTQYELSAEYLRVYSPSAEVRGHGIGNHILQSGKKFVAIEKIEPAGHYALKITFDDGHDSGLYSWDYLYQLATQQQERWQNYLDELNAQNKTRDNGLIGRG